MKKFKLQYLVLVCLFVQITLFIFTLFFKSKELHLLLSITQIFTMISAISLIVQSTKSMRQSRKKLEETMNMMTANRAINRNRDAFPMSPEGISLRGLTCSICGSVNTDGHQCGHLRSRSLIDDPWQNDPNQPADNQHLSKDPRTLFKPLKVRRIEFISKGKQNGNK